MSTDYASSKSFAIFSAGPAPLGLLAAKHNKKSGDPLLLRKNLGRAATPGNNSLNFKIQYFAMESKVATFSSRFSESNNSDCALEE